MYLIRDYSLLNLAGEPTILTEVSVGFCTSPTSERYFRMTQNCFLLNPFLLIIYELGVTLCNLGIKDKRVKQVD